MFGLGNNDKCPVDKEVSDEFVITNHGPTRKFTFFVPAENDKFTCRLYPGSGVIKSVPYKTAHAPPHTHYRTRHRTTHYRTHSTARHDTR
jgi:hypothetical protein